MNALCHTFSQKIICIICVSCGWHAINEVLRHVDHQIGGSDSEPSSCMPLIVVPMITCARTQNLSMCVFRPLYGALLNAMNIFVIVLPHVAAALPPLHNLPVSPKLVFTIKRCCFAEVDAARKKFEAKFAALRHQHSPQAVTQSFPERSLRQGTGSRKGM